MITIPIEIGPGAYDLVVVLEQGNIDRIKAYDPAEVILPKIGMPWSAMKLRTVMLAFGTDAEVKQLCACETPLETMENLRILSRGWRFRPKDTNESD